MNYKVWNKQDEINGVNAQEVKKSLNIQDSDEIFLILNEQGTITNVEFSQVIKANHGLDNGLSVDEVAQEYIRIHKEEKDRIENEQASNEEKARDKIDILQAENADLLLDSANKDIQMKTLEKDLADLTLQIAGGIQ